jgi:pimeloyl-ACP methyl ester carboxylesterase
LNYSVPGSDQIRLVVVRHRATEPSRRLGTLFFNPGGPAGTATGQFAGWIDFFPAELRRRFDLVSWDPRGVGFSTPVQCFASLQAEGAFFGQYANPPVEAGQDRAYIRRWAAFGQRCSERVGRLLRHVGTVDTARDLDLLRQAVGEDELRYIGVSYGTFLGATYANLFPGRVGALVLDGNVAPSAWTAGGTRHPALSVSMRIGSDVGVGKALAAFLTLCGRASPANCAFSAGSPGATYAKWKTLLARLQKAPIATVSYAELLSQASGGGLDVVQPFTNRRLPDQSRAGAGDHLRRGPEPPGP